VRNLTLLPLVVLALLTVAFSIVGDLFESLIKRHAGVKDSGAMFPGHGGVADRLDGVFAALPIFVLGKALLGLCGRSRSSARPVRSEPARST
jgi:phosphatidate cytidylyltransferase